MTRLLPLLLALSPSLALGTTGTSTGPSWADEIADAFDAADPDGGWDVAPIPPVPAAARTKADILIESLATGTAATWRGDVTLKRGLLAAVSPDGDQGLVLAERALACGSAGCTWLDLPTEDELPVPAAGCIFPLCGGDALSAASPAWVIVDIAHARDGSELWIPRTLLIAFDTALIGVEPDEID